MVEVVIGMMVAMVVQAVQLEQKVLKLQETIVEVQEILHQQLPLKEMMAEVLKEIKVAKVVAVELVVMVVLQIVVTVPLEVTVQHLVYPVFLLLMLEAEAAV